MANKIVVVYQHVKISNKWTFKKVPATRRQFLSNGAVKGGAKPDQWGGVKVGQLMGRRC